MLRGVVACTPEKAPALEQHRVNYSCFLGCNFHLNYTIKLCTHSKLCLAAAKHNFNWVQITDIVEFESNGNPTNLKPIFHSNIQV